jgi:glycosyltransferase involved in cell wall biosynthesis
MVTFPLGSTPPAPGLRVFRTPNPLGFRAIPTGFSLRKVFLDAFLFFLTWGRLHRESYVCVHAAEEAAFYALPLCRLYGVPLIYDMQSSLPEHLSLHRGFRNRAAQRLCRVFERQMLNRADRVACSSGLAGHVRRVAPTVPLTEWQFPAGLSAPDPERVRDLYASLDVPQNARLVVYTGTFHEYQGISLLADAIPDVARCVPDAYFVLAGAADSDELEKVRTRLLPECLGRVRLLLRQTRNDSLLLQQMADVLVSTRIHGGNLPLKIFDYLASGRPVVATDIPAHRAILDETRALLVRPEPKVVGDALVELLEDRERAGELASHGLAFMELRAGRGQFLRDVAGLLPRSSGAAPAAT